MKHLSKAALALTIAGSLGTLAAPAQAAEVTPTQLQAAVTTPTYNFGVPNQASLQFVADKLAQENDFQLPAAFVTSAEYWQLYAFFQGYIVDLEPQVGSVAWFDAEDFGAGDYGHVAWVKSVNGDEVEIEEINQDHRRAPYTYRTRTINREEVGGYIHFKDLGQ